MRKIAIMGISSWDAGEVGVRKRTDKIEAT